MKDMRVDRRFLHGVVLALVALSAGCASRTSIGFYSTTGERTDVRVRSTDGCPVLLPFVKGPGMGSSWTEEHVHLPGNDPGEIGKDGYAHIAMSGVVGRLRFDRIVEIEVLRGGAFGGRVVIRAGKENLVILSKTEKPRVVINRPYGRAFD